MVKPIPVFAFVFAAYAATHPPDRRGFGKFGDSRNADQDKPSPGAAWRTLARQGVDVWVKIGVVEGGGIARPWVAAQAEPGNDLK